jgi:hypothetical protein
VTAGSGACAIRNPDDAVCACANVPDSTSPAKAAQIATVTIRFI